MSKPRHAARPIFSALSLLIGLSKPAGAFNIDGFYSGETNTQVNAALALSARKLTKYADYNGTEFYFVQDKKRDSIYGNMLFCNDHLFYYAHSIDFDAEYTRSALEIEQAFGTHPVFKVDRQPWAGPGGGYIDNIRLSWHGAFDTVELSFNTEGRDGKGQLRFTRSANIAWASPAPPPCLQSQN